MTAEPTDDRPVAAWMQALETIEDLLARRLAEVRELPAPSAESEPTAKAALKALDERLSAIKHRLDEAERDAGDADGVLHTEAEAYRRWTDGMTAARRRLADWAAGVK